MKHKAFPVILTILILMTLLPGCAAVSTIDRAEDKIEHALDRTEDKIEDTLIPSAPPAADNIGQEEAERIALEHAGLTREQVQHLRTEFEIDDGIRQYDVQFYADRFEYEYEINAQTGAIISFDRDN